MMLSPVLKKINILRNRSGDFSARSYPVILPTYEKQLKKSLELGVAVHTFNFRIPEAEAGRCMGLRQDLETQFQNSFGSERKH